jgi:hypothetical protein
MEVLVTTQTLLPESREFQFLNGPSDFLGLLFWRQNVTVHTPSLGVFPSQPVTGHSVIKFGNSPLTLIMTGRTLAVREFRAKTGLMKVFMAAKALFLR